MNKEKRKIRKAVVALSFILTIVLAVIIYIVPQVTGMMVETYTAEYGDLSIFDDTYCVFVRNEKVYSASSGGEVNRLAEEGELIRPFTGVVEISGEVPLDISQKLTDIKNKLGQSVIKSKDYKVEGGGIVSYFVDGYENSLTFREAWAITKDELDSMSQSQVIDVGTSVGTDYPVFKIVDNNGWQIIAYVSKEHLENYNEGGLVDVTFFERPDSSGSGFPDLSKSDPLGNRVEMIVDRIGTEGEFGKLLLRTTRFFSGVGQYRICNCRIVSEDVSGLLIENGSLAEKDGVQGVYVKNKIGKYDFIPVLVFGSNDTTTVIADTYFYNSDGEYIKTVDPFDDVLRNPEIAEKDD